MLARVGRHAEAVECIEHSLQLQPDAGMLWADLGVSLDALRRHELAIGAFETALFRNPDAAWVWGRLGQSLHSLGRHDEALRALEKSVDGGHAPVGVLVDMGAAAAELRDVARLRAACDALDKVDAQRAAKLRERLRSLEQEAAA